MSKKILLLSLMAVSAVTLALPEVASSQEAHIDGVTHFTGSGGASTFAASGEPTTTCEGTTVEEGKVETGGTTGSMSLDFTGCHIIILGLTRKCRSPGAPVTNTTTASGTFHVITVSAGKPALLITPNQSVFECEGSNKKTTVNGSIIGTITSPACEGESREVKLGFAATGSTQNDRTYTGANFDLTATTEGGSPVTAGNTWEATLKSETTWKLTCT